MSVCSQQIIETFFVNFKVVEANLELCSFIFNLGVHEMEEVSDCPWNDAIQLLDVFCDRLTALNLFNDLLRT